MANLFFTEIYSLVYLDIICDNICRINSILSFFIIQRPKSVYVIYKLFKKRDCKTDCDFYINFSFLFCKLVWIDPLCLCYLVYNNAH
jgi:hypothetical protein